MKITKSIALLVVACGLAACEAPPDKTADRGVDRKELPSLVAGIWVDPNGCDHWIIDDGLEGYLSARLDRNTGKPVCSGIAPPTVATEPFKAGSRVPDLI